MRSVGDRTATFCEFWVNCCTARHAPAKFDESRWTLVSCQVRDLTPMVQYR